MDTNITPSTETPTLDTIEKKRDFLRQMSNSVAPLVEAEQYGSVNEAVIDVFYKSPDNTEFRTFNEWKKDGYSIRKGSKAFLVWGKPQPLRTEQAEAQEEPATDGPKKDKEFFPIAFLFSNAQVEKKGEQKNA